MEKQLTATAKTETYGTRKCLVCKSSFEADKPWRITCSEKCSKERRKDLHRKSDARRKLERKANWLELLADLNHADNELSWLNFQYENLLCTTPMNSGTADGKFEDGVYYKLRYAEAENEKLKAEINKLKEELDGATGQETGLKDALAKEQERNAEILEETAKLKVEIARMVKENGETVRELQEKLAYAEKQIGELQAQGNKPREPETKYPIPRDGGYELRCQECGEIFWSRNKENFCCVECYRKNQKRKAAEEAEAKGYPAKKAKK